MNIEIKELVFAYPNGVLALEGVTVGIPTGSLVAIVGQNGAGKTTLVKHLNGLLRPTSGLVQIGDWDTRQRSVAELANRIGFIFQNPDDQLFCRTVKEEVQFGPRSLGFENDRIETLVEAALELTELHEKASQNPYDLSPAWRKMVALASILAMDTPIVVMDEPTTGQDAVSIERISRIVQSLHGSGKTVIAITHDIDFCAENFERMIVMRQGMVVLDGPIQEVVAEREMLASTYVEQPQITRLAKRLGFSTIVYKPDDFIRVLHDS
ncbi:MAG: ABC transporter ATP-binding protein [Anaerolineales bacterium]|nr:ABC transporter ATP-binding protein [Anaerolineales bacterium]